VEIDWVVVLLKVYIASSMCACGVMIVRGLKDGGVKNSGVEESGEE
jgi:hypothetical protein